MRIESLHLEGVGPFENTTIELPRGTRDDLADVYLLVGENGCGKTTAIHSIALALGGVAVSDLHADGRIWSDGGHVRLNCGAKSFASVRPGPRSTPQLGGMSMDSRVLRGVYGYTWSGSHDEQFELWRDSIGLGQVAGPHPVSWAAFGYSGQRSLTKGEVTALEEDSTGPLAGSLSFTSRPEDSTKLSKWLAGQRYKMLKAREAGLEDRADQAARSIAAIESAVRDVVGRGFAFNFSVDDNHVRAVMGGRVVDWAYLPEGCKAIVSWIGDLLMRMNRVGWVHDLPLDQREFLLLLDEIDIHLHPAWQRKVLPMVQRLFPRAQIIASTHSPFVVASLEDGAVIELKLDDAGRSHAQKPKQAPLRQSVSATLQGLFGIKSDFDLETEQLLTKLQEARNHVLAGRTEARAQFEDHARRLIERGEEVAQLVHYERVQLERRLPRPTGT